MTCHMTVFNYITHQNNVLFYLSGITILIHVARFIHGMKDQSIKVVSVWFYRSICLVYFINIQKLVAKNLQVVFAEKVCSAHLRGSVYIVQCFLHRNFNHFFYTSREYFERYLVCMRLPKQLKDATSHCQSAMTYHLVKVPISKVKVRKDIHICLPPSLHMFCLCWMWHSLVHFNRSVFVVGCGYLSF